MPAIDTETADPSEGVDPEPRRGISHATVYQELRTAHLERSTGRQRSLMIYGSERYDFDRTLANSLPLVRAEGLADVARAVFRAAPDVLEINEPAMLHGIERGAVAVAAAKIGARLRGKNLTVVSYAIENRDPWHDLPATGKARVRRLVQRCLSRWVAGQLDRLAYGTDGSRSLYTARWGGKLRATEQRLFPALPCPCACPAASKDFMLIVFLGAFVERKGALRLLDAWPHVRRQSREATLMWVGKGPLEGLVKSVSNDDPSMLTVIDPSREKIHQLLRRARVLVLLSQPADGWREQVGLPIVEGLAHGCVVVTTTETGIAGWLRDHGHLVLNPRASAEAVAEALRTALEQGPSTRDVLDSLPVVDGRLDADSWMRS